MSGELFPDFLFEPTVLPVADGELVEGYRNHEVPGPIVMGRFLEKLDWQHVAEAPLLDRQRQAITKDGRELTIQDYLDIAEGHGPAIEIILNFIEKSENDSDYKDATEGLRAFIKGYLPEGYLNKS